MFQDDFFFFCILAYILKQLTYKQKHNKKNSCSVGPGSQQRAVSHLMGRTGQRLGPGTHTHRRFLRPVHTRPLTSLTSRRHEKHTASLKHLVAMRELFLRMMRSSYYWRSGLTLHLFCVALMEWWRWGGGSFSCECLAMHPLRSALLYPLVFHISASSVVLWSALYVFYMHAKDICGRLIMRSRPCERRLCVSCMRVVLPHQQSLPSPNADTHLHSDNAIRRHHRNLI